MSDYDKEDLYHCSLCGSYNFGLEATTGNEESETKIEIHCARCSGISVLKAKSGRMVIVPHELDGGITNDNFQEEKYYGE